MDVKKFYPNIDTKMTLKFIIKKIYEKPLDFFPKNKDEHGQMIFLPKHIFESFLTKFFTNSLHLNVYQVIFDKKWC
jgi:hypothetical protein